MNKDFNELEEKNLNFIYQQLIKLKVVTGKWKELKFKYINDDIQLSYIPYLSEDDNEIKIDITDFAVKEQIKKVVKIIIKNLKNKATIGKALYFVFKILGTIVVTTI